MPRPPQIPDFAREGPFTRAQARAAGMSDRRLQGRQFVRVHPRVWRWAGYRMTPSDWQIAAQLAMPERARLSHVSRIQRTGLDVGPLHPVHLTITGDHHLAVEGIFLHRTEVMPPTDAVGVTPAAAFVQCCASMPLLDLVVIGDHLLRVEAATPEEIAAVARLHPWRPGAAHVRSVLPWLHPRSWSPKESELRAYVVASGLPTPEVNAEIRGFDGTVIGIGDLWFPRWRLVVEYEGRQHAEDPRQFRRDIERYAAFRDHDVAYVQVTAAMTADPTAVVQRIHTALVRRGYDGSPPRFGARWGSLFCGVRISGDPATVWRVDSVDEPPTLPETG